MSCPDWPKGYCRHSHLFDLFKGLSLHRAPLQITLLLSYLVQRAHSKTVVWDMKPIKARKAWLSFLVVGGDIAAILLMTFIGIW